MAPGPVVASAVQGLTEIATDGQTGLLVPAEDPVALAEAVQRLLNGPELPWRMASAARAEALTRFPSSGYRQRILEAVVALVGRYGSTRSASLTGCIPPLPTPLSHLGPRWKSGTRVADVREKPMNV